MIHLQSVSLRPLPERGDFPLNLPIIQTLKELRFEQPVTLFVGENGSGKSTLLEGLACAIESIVVGSESTKHDPSLAHARLLAKYLRLSWTKRTRRGFFLRAEDFFGYARRLNQMRTEMESDLEQIDEEYKERSEFAHQQARMAAEHELGGLRNRYGEGLEARSHGESFLALFQARFVPGGLYLLDEPEAPLSPLRQLALVSLLKEMLAQEAQFIIATHSPILMAFPGAAILNFEGGEIRRAEYEDLEHVRLMRTFLNDPQAFLRNL
jgi:predicted ATPase